MGRICSVDIVTYSRPSLGSLSTVVAETGPLLADTSGLSHINRPTASSWWHRRVALHLANTVREKVLPERRDGDMIANVVVYVWINSADVKLSLMRPLGINHATVCTQE